MGNSNSQFRRNRSQYGSSRSVAFSLPPSWDRRNFAYGEPREFDHNSSVDRTPSKPILRKNSSGAASMGYPSYRNGLGSNGRSQSLHSLPIPQRYDGDGQSSFNRHASITSLPQISSHQLQLSRRQYSDIYLKNDLKRVFRTQNRANSVAHLEGQADTDLFDSTTSLDKRLLTLKSQRARSVPEDLHHNKPQQSHAEPRRDGATERRIKSRKSKKAPIPNPNILPLYNHPPAAGKPQGMYRKKANAPQPPVKRASSMSPLAVGTDTTDAHLQLSSLKHSLFQEIEAELAKHNIPISPSNSEVIPIPRPDYDRRQLMGKATGPPTLPKPTTRRTKTQAPTTPATVVQANRTANAMPLVQAPVLADVEVHAPPIDMTAGTGLVAQPKEVREMAVQYNAPVEIAIQCDENALKQNRSGSPPSSLTDLISHLFTEAIKSAQEDIHNEKRNDQKYNPDNVENSSCYSDSSSSRSRNSDQQKIVPMHEVLAGVPPPPPLPDFKAVKLLQTKTIRENAAVSMAPPDLPTADKSYDDTESLDNSPQSFSAFHKEILEAYEKIDKKRQVSPTQHKSAKHPLVASISSEASALRVFRHSTTIMGVKTPTEHESDSGNDEPSDSNLSQGDGTSRASLPDFVLNDLSKNVHNNHSDSPSKSSTKSSSKSKFNSIKRIKNSVRQLLSLKTQAFEEENISYIESDSQRSAYSDENWTLSGRSKAPRPTVTEPSTFTSTNTHEQKHSGMNMTEGSFHSSQNLSSPDSIQG